MTILDTWKLGQSFLKILARKPNVEIRYSTEATGYVIKDSKVTKVQTNKGDVSADLVVLCNGPEAPYHIYKHFGCVLPSI